MTVPSELESKILAVLETAKNSGKIAKGTNEATKAIERGNAQLVVTADDVDPKEVVMHIPVICDEKKIAHAEVSSKDELGQAAGLEVPTATAAVIEPGAAGQDELKEVIKEVKSQE